MNRAKSEQKLQVTSIRFAKKDQNIFIRGSDTGYLKIEPLILKVNESRDIHKPMEITVLQRPVPLSETKRDFRRAARSTTIIRKSPITIKKSQTDFLIRSSKLSLNMAYNRPSVMYYVGDI